MRRRLEGLIAAGLIWVPSLWVIVWGAGRLPLHFVLVLAIAGAALLAALKLSLLARARIDPSVEPTFGAQRPFEWGRPGRRNR